MSRKIELSVDHLSTISLALIGWAVRCDREADAMEKLAAEIKDEFSDKARRNAAASREFAAEARKVRDFIVKTRLQA